MTVKERAERIGRKTGTLRQRGFVKDYIETKNGTEAAARNYDTKDRNVASAIAVENLGKPLIKTLLQEALESVGLTKDKIAKGIEDITKANQPIIFEGEVVSEYPAHDTRLKAFRLSAELIDAFPAKKHENRSAHLNIHVGYTKNELRRLLKGK